MIELLTTAEMAEADRLAIEARHPGHPADGGGRPRGGRCGGAACARRGLCGGRPGNNGGDGFVCARILADRGYPVRLLLLGDPEKLKGDAAEAFRSWSGAVEPATPAGLAGADLIVDALFGAGLDRPVTGAARAMIEAINATTCDVIAVDLPSGINGTQRRRDGCRRERERDRYVLPAEARPSCCCPAGCIADRLRWSTSGFPKACSRRSARAFSPMRRVSGPAAFAVPQAGGHKYRRGHAGGRRAVRRTPARRGLRRAVRCEQGRGSSRSRPRATRSPSTPRRASPSWCAPVDGAAELAAMLADPRLNTVVLGPGGGVGAPMREMVLAALRGRAGRGARRRRADELRRGTSDAVRAPSRRAGRRRRCCTPHEGEFARLFSYRPATIWG